MNSNLKASGFFTVPAHAARLTVSPLVQDSPSLDLAL
jgi:hypothetical protein